MWMCGLDLLGPKKIMCLLIWSKLSWTDFERQIISCLIGRISSPRNACSFQTQNAWLCLQIFLMLLFEIVAGAFHWKLGCWGCWSLSLSIQIYLNANSWSFPMLAAWVEKLRASSSAALWFLSSPLQASVGLCMWHPSEKSVLFLHPLRKFRTCLSSAKRG